MLVYILNKNNQPLMPCKPAKASKLLREKRAEVVKRTPFTIKLKYGSSGYVQKAILGIDTGYQLIGFSAINEKQELISGEVKLDCMMPKRLQDRAMYRKSRRNRLWYRKPRWRNRIGSKKKGWLPPSIQRRYETHLKLIELIKQMLPIHRIIIEVGNFDIQKINNPDIQGKEYQQGNMYEYQNIRSYLMRREHGKCQLCGKEFSKTNSSHMHHIIPKMKGGTDKTNNLSLLHQKCHIRLHKKGLYNQLKKNKQYKDSTFMNIVKWKYKKDIDCDITYGAYTFSDRVKIGMEKSHVNDAFIIAKGEIQSRCHSFNIEQKRRNNRCLQVNRKKFKPSIRRKRYKHRPGDLVKINGNLYEVKGIHSYGTRIRLLDSSGNIINISTKKLDDWIYHQKTLIWRAA